MPAPRRKITVIGANYAPEVTGNAPYTASLSTALASAGHSVEVITTHPHYPEWVIRDGYGKWSQTTVEQGVVVHRLRHFVPRQPTPWLRMASEVSFGLRAAFRPWGRPEVVLLISPSLFATAVVSVRAWLSGSRFRSMVWVQDLYSLGVVQTGTSTGRVAAAVQRVEQRTLAAADRVVVIHPTFADFVIGTLGLPAERVSVIRNWSHVTLRPARTRDAERQRRHWPDDLVVAVHAGNQGVKQGLDNVVDAARRAEQEGRPIRYVLLGNGNQHDRLVAAASSCSAIEFLDTLDDADFAALLAAGDVLVVNELPGMRQMSVPSKLTTYFAAGRPVVAATDADSVTASELAASGGGVRVGPADPDALNDAVLRIGSDRAAADTLAAAGSRYRSRLLTEQAAVAAFLDLI